MGELLVKQYGQITADGLWPTPELIAKCQRLHQQGLSKEVLEERFGQTIVQHAMLPKAKRGPTARELGARASAKFREEVLALHAQGQTNRQIAEKLATSAHAIAAVIRWAKKRKAQ